MQLEFNKFTEDIVLGAGDQYTHVNTSRQSGRQLEARYTH
jgi:hypothetical protein